MAKTDDADKLTTDDKFELLIQALMTRKDDGLDKDALREILAENTAATQKALKPENTNHPAISAFSYPEGDRQKPKAPLPYQLFWNNYPAYKFSETEAWYEWELYH